MEIRVCRSKIMGSAEVPPSKSLTHRAIILASLTPETSKIHNPLICEDTKATIEACRKIGAAGYLRMLALSRLFLDNFANLQASWVTQGLDIGQAALLFGANDMGSLMIEENVVAAAGTRFRIDEVRLRRAIELAGFVPRRRNVFYQHLEPPSAETGSPGNVGAVHAS